MKRLIVSIVLVCALSLCAFGQGSSIPPYTTPLWRTFLDGTTAEFQADSDSTTFFQVKNAAGADFFNIDTTNQLLHLNSLTGLIDLGQYNNNNTAGLRFRGGNDSKNVYLRSHATDGRTVEMQTNAGVAMQIWDSFGNIGFPNVDAGATFTFDYSTTSKGTVLIRGRNQDVLAIRELTIAGDPTIMLSIEDLNGNAQSVFTGTQGGWSFGLGEISPETLFEMTGAAPYLTIHNSTHEDTDGGRESRLNFKGEQSGGEETTLARIQASHVDDGVDADDEKGQLQFYTNADADGDSPTLAMTIDSSQNVIVNSLMINERSSDPSKPSEGTCIIWMSDGAEFGDDGDVCIASTAGGVTTRIVLYDKSAGAVW